MAEKKLTKVQKEILQTLRDVEGARIVMGFFDSQPRLYVGKEIIKSIVTESFYFIRVWLKEGYNHNTRQTVYTFREGAEISDTWRRDELARQGLESLNRQAEEARQKQVKEEQAEARLREVWEVLITGDLIEDLEIYPHVIIFTHNGRKYYIREE